MLITTKKSLDGLMILLLALCLSSPVYADHHHDGGGHDGGGHHHGGVDFGLYFGSPYYYPYNPYYYPYPNNVIVISPQTVEHHTSAPKDVTVMKAQVQLVSQGYYNGSVDGINGPQTQAAIKAFQHNKGLSETGNLDDATLKALGVSK